MSDVTYCVKLNKKLNSLDFHFQRVFKLAESPFVSTSGDSCLYA